jgi:hypothetical protein
MKAAISLLVIIVAACGQSSVPTEQEARRFLEDVVAAAKAGDINTLCAMSNCSADDRSKPVIAPIDPPTVVGTRIIQPASIPGGGETLGGQVLVLCGIGIDAEPYQFEMLVFRANGQLHTPSFKYWTNMGVSGGVAATTPPGPDRPVFCPTD